jgi:5-deoxy-glucuronate isomerase
MLLRAVEQPGYQDIVGADNAARLKWLRFGLLRLHPGESFTGETETHEVVLVLLEGACDIEAGEASFSGLTRENVFQEKATAVYVPIATTYTVKNTGVKPMEVAVCKAPADTKYSPFIVRPEEVWDRPVGRDNFLRHVHDIVVKNAEGNVQRIIVGETFNLPGNWSSYPPHKHDDYKPGVEACMEEVYHYRLNPSHGFGLQSLYTADGSTDEVYRVQDKDTFMIPYGYHPVCAGAGYELYYLWVMAGDVDRVMIPNDDPQHTWVRQ